MSAGSGLLLPTIDDLMATGRGCAGVNAVLDAADAIRDRGLDHADCQEPA